MLVTCVGILFRSKIDLQTFPGGPKKGQLSLAWMKKKPMFAYYFGSTNPLAQATSSTHCVNPLLMF